MALPTCYQALVYLAAGTGVRQGEAFGLTSDNVNLVELRLEVVQQMITVAGSSSAYRRRTRNSRTVPLPDLSFRR